MKAYLSSSTAADCGRCLYPPRRFLTYGWDREPGPVRKSTPLKQAVPGRKMTAQLALPSREELIAFIGGEAAPNGEQAARPRDQARHRPRLRRQGRRESRTETLIKDLQNEGAIARGRKALTPGRLPAIVVADIAERDRDGELVARPVEWNGDGRRRESWSAARARSAKPAPRRASARAC